MKIKYKHHKVAGIVLILLQCIAQPSLQAQYSAQYSNNVFVSIFNSAGKKTYAGKLVEIKDSSLVVQIIINDQVRVLESIDYRMIGSVKAGRSILTGVTVGIITGGIVGLIGYLSCDCGDLVGPEASLGTALWGGVLGLFVGAAADKPKLKVNQNFEQFTMAANKLRKIQLRRTGGSKTEK